MTKTLSRSFIHGLAALGASLALVGCGGSEPGNEPGDEVGGSPQGATRSAAFAPTQPIDRGTVKLDGRSFLAIDGQGRLNIVGEHRRVDSAGREIGGSVIEHGVFVNGNWSFKEVYSGAFNKQIGGFAAGPNNTLHLLFASDGVADGSTTHQVTYGKHTGGVWSLQTVHTLPMAPCAIQNPSGSETVNCVYEELTAGPVLLDSQGVPHLIFGRVEKGFGPNVGNIGKEISLYLHARPAGAGWLLESTNFKGYDELNISGAIDGSNRIHLVSAKQFGTSELVYARRETNGSWTKKTVASNLEGISGTKIKIDGQGRPVIAAAADETLVHVYRATSTGFLELPLPPNVSTNAYSIDLQVDLLGQLHLVSVGDPASFFVNPADNPKPGTGYARFTGDAWTPLVTVTREGFGGARFVLQGDTAHIITDQRNPETVRDTHYYVLGGILH